RAVLCFALVWQGPADTPLEYWLARSSRAMTVFLWPNLLTPPHDLTGNRLRFPQQGHALPRLLARGACGLSATPRTHRAAPGLFGGLAVLARRPDVAGLDDGKRRRYQNHRPVCVCRHALLDQGILVACSRCARHPRAHAPARPAARMAAAYTGK